MFQAFRTAVPAQLVAQFCQVLGAHQTNVILQGETTDEPTATLYAYITNSILPRLRSSTTVGSDR